MGEALEALQTPVLFDLLSPCFGCSAVGLNLKIQFDSGDPEPDRHRNLEGYNRNKKNVRN